MGCNRLKDCLDTYVDGELPERERAGLDEHLRGCAACSELLARERRLRQMLNALPVSEPSPGFMQEITMRASAQTSSRRRQWMAALGGALAAGLAITWVALAPLGGEREEAASSVATVTMTLHETRTVRLVFGSAEEIRDARLLVTLPPGVTLAGHGARQSIRWRTSLRPGNNVLPLELVVNEGTGGDLVARLEHGDKHRTFRVRVAVAPDATPRRGSVPAIERSTPA